MTLNGKQKWKERVESSTVAKLETPGIKEWILNEVWIFKKIQTFVWENVAGEQVLLTSNIFHANPSNFPKFQAAINTHSAMLGGLNLDISYVWHALSFISGICSIPRPLLMIGKVTCPCPCHAKSLLRSVIKRFETFRSALFLSEDFDHDFLSLNPRSTGDDSSWVFRRSISFCFTHYPDYRACTLTDSHQPWCASVHFECARSNVT